MIPGLSEEVNKYYLANPVAYVQDMVELRGNPLIPYTYQVPVLETLPQMEPDLPEQIRCMAVLGARQIFGKSTTASMIGVWYAPLHDNSEISIISHRQRRSDKMLANIKRYMLANPLLLAMTKKGGNTDLAWSSSEVGLTNGTLLTSLPEGNDADSSVGDTTNLAIIDEVARFKSSDSIKGSIMPTLFESFGSIIMFSSSWGRGGRGEYWYQIIKNDDYIVFSTDAKEALTAQFKRWKYTIGEEKATELLRRKLKWLEFQKRELGNYLYQMQYMNSFEYGLDNAFEQRDLEICFTDIPQLTAPIHGRRYIETVDFGKSIKTGDRTVVSIYDYTDIENIECVYRHPYSILYTKTIPKIVDPAIIFNPDGIYCDLGGGEKQVEDLTIHPELVNRGIKTTGIIASGTMKKSTSDFEDKGILRKTISKYQCGNRLVSYIEHHNIKYCRDCMREEYDDYLVVQTPGGSRTYNHPPDGHDDAIDTDITLMAVIGESITFDSSDYDVGVVQIPLTGKNISHYNQDSIVTL